MPAPLDKITYFGQTDYRGKRIKFGIKDSDRAKHMYVIGKTGMGKSTLLENLAVQDIQNGEGVCFIDPHGGSAELLLSYVPENRIKDVIYFAPFDYDFPIALNVMEDIGKDKRPLVASGLIGAMKKVWVDAWSPRMEYLLSNALLALLEYPNTTLLGVNRVFADKEYRAQIVANVTDPSVRAFWVDEFAKYSDKFATEATAAIQNKIGQFAANPLIRNIVGQAKSSFDIRKAMDEKKIFIINLSKGRIGEGNANLLGSMLITKIYLAAMSRADSTPDELKKLPNFYLYVDEFQSFANESFADILSEARKYHLSLTIAHQYIEQMSEEVRAAVFGNVGTMISFRVGAYDAEVLEKEFAPTFTIEDIVNLGARQIYLKLMIDGQGSSPFSATTLPPIPIPEASYADKVIAASREQFARPRSVIEEEIRKWHEPVPPPPRDPNAPPETKKFSPGMRPGGGPSGGGNRPPRSDAPQQQSYAPRANESTGALGAAIKAALVGGPTTLPLSPSSPAPYSSGGAVPLPSSAPLPSSSPVAPDLEPLPPSSPLEPSIAPAPKHFNSPSAPGMVVVPRKPAVVRMASPHAPSSAPISSPLPRNESGEIQSSTPQSRYSEPVQPKGEDRFVVGGDRRSGLERRTGDRRLGDSRIPPGPDDRSRSPRPVSIPQRPPTENETPRAPLSVLKTDKRDKGPSKGNLSALRSVIASAGAQPQAPSLSPVPEAATPPPPRRDPAPPFEPNITPTEQPFFESPTAVPPPPTEVPEDVLRNILAQ